MRKQLKALMALFAAFLLCISVLPVMAEGSADDPAALPTDGATPVEPDSYYVLTIQELRTLLKDSYPGDVNTLDMDSLHIDYPVFMEDVENLKDADQVVVKTTESSNVTDGTLTITISDGNVYSFGVKFNSLQNQDDDQGDETGNNDGQSDEPDGNDDSSSNGSQESVNDPAAWPTGETPFQADSYYVLTIQELLDMWKNAYPEISNSLAMDSLDILFPSFLQEYSRDADKLVVHTATNSESTEGEITFTDNSTQSQYSLTVYFSSSGNLGDQGNNESDKNVTLATLESYTMSASSNESSLTKTNGTALNEQSQKLYEILKARIIKIAKGEESSATITVPVTEFGVKTEYTDADLGIQIYNPETGTFNSEQVAQIIRAQFTFDFAAVMERLRQDMPFELYWNYATTGVPNREQGPGIGCSYNGEGHATIKGDYTFELAVESKYRAEDAYTVDTSKLSVIYSTSSTTAQGVVNDAADMSDYEKLVYYKDWICGQVTYDTESASNSATKTDRGAWNLVNVFDSLNTTNVVCEGYAEAFQYLCDLTTFNSPLVKAYCVSGTMTGGTGAGPHKWNVVRMPDGNNYVADITVSDHDDQRMYEFMKDKVFLAGAEGDSNEYVISWPKESRTDGNTTITYPDGTIRYRYNDNTKTYYSDEERTVSETAYNPSAVYPESIELNYTELERALGGTVQLTATVNPSGADQNVIWNSSDESVATVDENGKVTVVGTGTADITAISTSNPEISTTCKLTAINAITARSASLILEGNIGVRFKMVVPDPENTTLEITIDMEAPKEDIHKTMTASQGRKEVVNGEVQYCFDVFVNAKQMNDKIVLKFKDAAGNTIQVSNSDGEIVQPIYSVDTYFKHMMSTDNQKLKKLIEAMRVYGDCAQVNFNYRVGEATSTNIPEVDTTKLKQATQEGEDLPGLEIESCTLVLESETTVRYVLNVTGDNSVIDRYTYELDGRTVTPKYVDNEWRIEATNIYAQDLDEVHRLKVSKDEDHKVTYIYGPESYWYNKLTDSNSTESLQNLCKAMYWYNQAANAYFEGE